MLYPDEIVTSDPIKKKIIEGNIAVALEDYLQIPAIFDMPPRNRINLLYHIKGDKNRLFVCDMLGKIYLIKNGILSSKPFLDVGKALWPDFYSAGWESGVSSFAFHPDYDIPGKAGYGKFYTVHSGPPEKVHSNKTTRLFINDKFPVDHYNVISEWSIDEHNPDKIDPGSYREIMRIAQPYEVHDTGTIAFNYSIPEYHPDYGKMYISVGDGGLDENNQLIVEPNRQAQNTKSIYGKILRINPLQVSSNAYSIPDDNPFISNQDYLPEIWALGFRNPQRFSWDARAGGYMFITDIGESNIEEVNIGKAGSNYGWSMLEGTFSINPQKRSELFLTHDKKNDQFLDPVAMFDHDEGNAITGGYVYRRFDIPDLYGKYIFGDIAAGAIFYINADHIDLNKQSEIKKLQIYYNGRKMNYQNIIDNDRINLRFGLGADGSIYTLSKTDGMIRKMVPVNYIIRSNGDWFLFSDKYKTGTKIWFDKETFTSEVVSITMTKASDPAPASSDKRYPYVGMGFHPVMSIARDCDNCEVILEINYKLKGNMEFLVEQDNITPGNEYRLKLEPSEEYVKRRYRLSDFSLPRWVNQGPGLDADHFQGVKFQLNTSKSSKAALKIKSINIMQVSKNL